MNLPEMTEEAGLFLFYHPTTRGRLRYFSFSTNLLLDIFCNWYVFIVLHKGDEGKQGC